MIVGKVKLYVTEVSTSQDGWDPVVQVIKVIGREDGEEIDSFQVSFYTIQSTDTSAYISEYKQVTMPYRYFVNLDR